MKKSILILSALAIFAVGVLCSPLLLSRGHAQTRAGIALGGGHAGVVIENFRYQTLKGNRATVRTQRDDIVVPLGYGQILTVTQIKDRSVVWFLSNEGALRNVVLQDGFAPVKITRQQ